MECGMNQQPRPALINDHVEKVYAMAEIHWLQDQEAGETSETVEFEGDFSSGWCFMEIYLEQVVAAGETVVIPIALYNSMVPADQLVREGARFCVRQSGQ